VLCKDLLRISNILKGKLSSSLKDEEAGAQKGSGSSKTAESDFNPNLSNSTYLFLSTDIYCLPG
jgi:hypothetical protein